MEQARELLQQYFGFSLFRGKQEDIVAFAMDGNDVLGILPTGGGKSVCFQIPALAKEGCCLVVSPLLALMKDQVDQLKSRGIKAAYVSSAQTSREIDILLDNAVFGGIKLLYVSPERLMNQLFLSRFEKMNISMIAVDEAHCISQWGHDFRPAYRNIKAIRKLKPNVPIIALTASATPEVQEDIKEQLGIAKANQVQGDMKRKNLSLAVVKSNNKWQRILTTCKKLDGGGIIYTNTRKKTKHLAEFLRSHGVSVTYYHAGLGNHQKEEIQDLWITGDIRVVVSTNAFGMGIDKSDVRFVLHADVPSNPESYLQEAGRGGRDGSESWAILYYNDEDIALKQEQINERFPSLDVCRKIYQGLINQFQLATGSGKDESYGLNLVALAKRLEMDPKLVLQSLKVLEMAGYIQLSSGLHMPSRVHIVMDSKQMYDFQIKYPEWDHFIQLLTRSYGGMFDGFVKIQEGVLAGGTKLPTREIESKLERLKEMGVLFYEKKQSADFITFLSAVQIAKNLTFPKEKLKIQENRIRVQWTAMKNYLHAEKCREQYLLSYFGQVTDPCGHCDSCLKNGIEKSQTIEKIRGLILKKLTNNSMEMSALFIEMVQFEERELMEELRKMIDEKLVRNEEGILSIV